MPKPLLAALLAIAYSKAFIHMTGSWPSDAAEKTMATVWSYAGMITMPVAFLLGICGILPGTGGARNESWI